MRWAWACMSSRGRVLAVRWLGRRGYEQVYLLQKELVEARIRQEIPDTLILVEHFPVFTLGRGARDEQFRVPVRQIEALGLKIIPVDRGGQVTYHGPGQLVGYPIFDLTRHRQDLHWTLWALEEILIRFLKDFGIAGERRKDYPGVWVGEKKIAAIGIGVRRWVTYHGFALNINSDLNYFRLIYPCGIRDQGVTSLAEILGERVEITGDLLEKVVFYTGEVFQLEGEILSDEPRISGVAQEKIHKQSSCR
ncbi:MAG: lipoyl(octanoyl) transferase LipB [Bacillota bacterium]|nr:lipoyl(octanoyl) transferase LipB [Bacillota bacterium]